MSQTLAFPLSREHRMAPDFVCTVDADGDGREWVRVAGELDIATAPWLEQVLLHVERRARLVVVDLHELTFMDSSGVHVIVDAAIRARRSNRRLKLVGGCSQVTRMLALSEASDVLEIVEPDTLRAPVHGLSRLAEARLAA
jgi:anti-anti-sigma factor